MDDTITRKIMKIGLGDKPIFKALHYHTKRTTGLIKGTLCIVDTEKVGRWSAKGRTEKGTIQAWGFSAQEALDNLYKEIKK